MCERCEKSERKEVVGKEVCAVCCVEVGERAAG